MQIKHDFTLSACLSWTQLTLPKHLRKHICTALELSARAARVYDVIAIVYKLRLAKFVV